MSEVYTQHLALIGPGSVLSSTICHFWGNFGIAALLSYELRNRATSVLILRAYFTVGASVSYFDS